MIVEREKRKIIFIIRVPPFQHTQLGKLVKNHSEKYEKKENTKNMEFSDVP